MSSDAEASPPRGLRPQCARVDAHGRRTNRRTLLKGAALGTATAAIPAATARAATGGDEKRVQVAVVGGGLAGLYAAGRLRKRGRSVVLLEASDRVGGKVRNLSVGPGRNDIAEGAVGNGSTPRMCTPRRSSSASA
ncbi:MAG: NAD(P)-binding protein [Solirubrobacterales bacterium]